MLSGAGGGDHELRALSKVQEEEGRCRQSAGTPTRPQQPPAAFTAHRSLARRPWLALQEGPDRQVDTAPMGTGWAWFIGQKQRCLSKWKVAEGTSCNHST